MSHKKNRGAVLSFWHRLANSVSHSSTKPRPNGTRRDQLARRLRIEPLEDRCLLAVFTVSNVLDTGSGSLRQAILNANNTTAADTIEFKIGSGPQTISPASALPAITAPVTLDGTTQMGFVGQPIVELNGINAGPAANGLTLSGGGNTVRGLVISRFGRNGIDVNSPGNVIQGNTIRFNNGDGVSVSLNTGNAILSNSIFSNSDLGIDLSPNGVTLNDPNDTDTGANNLQNFPVLTSVTSGSNGTTIEGWLDSTPGIPFTLQFFSNSVADPTGFGEGQTYLGSTVVTTNSTGDASFLVTVTVTASVGQFVTATATDPGGNTSEFSATTVIAPPAADFGDAPAPYPTLAANNGARHSIRTGFHLGSGVDSESDGQRSSMADGDDTQGTDDEDGVVFTTPLKLGNMATVQVSASMAGLLGAWIDFNRDGDWRDTGEQVLANRSLVAGINSLSFFVPDTAVPGQTFGRFRLSTQGGQGDVGFDGWATEGEVEDYPVQIELGAIRGSKWNDLDFDGVRDAGEPPLEGWTIFLDDWGNGRLDDFELRTTTNRDGEYSFVGLGPGSYRVAEVMQEDWVQSFPARTELITVGSDGASRHPSISSDGRFVAFSSSATNLVPGDENDAADVFVLDRRTGTIEQVSVDSAGNEATFVSTDPSISGDGSFVAFQTFSSLVPEDTNDATDIYVFDRVAGSIERVSVDSEGNEADDFSSSASISADGRFVAFESVASDLVPNDSNVFRDIFVFDRQARTIERVSVDGAGNESNGASKQPWISANGRFVAFNSLAFNLVPGDNNVYEDVFVFDRQEGSIERVSTASDGTESNNFSADPSISGDGRWVAFESGANNLVAEDNNDYVDSFIYDRQFGTITRITGLADETHAPKISADGRMVAFSSWDDLAERRDVFLFDRFLGNLAGDPIRVSVNGTGHLADGSSLSPSISDDGQFVAFASDAEDLVAGDVNQESDIFVHTISAHLIRLSIGEEISGLDFGNRRMFDWGDAPAPYPTTDAADLAVNTGPRHFIVPGFYLGLGVDGESDGQPTAAADGDNTAGSDDEDGVVFLDAIRAGVPVDIQVTASADGWLNGWVDFNADGDWSDLREQVFAGEPLVAGINNLTVRVPLGAVVGPTYARFRFSSSDFLTFHADWFNFVDPPVDGEVEDYLITIEPNGEIGGTAWHDIDTDGQHDSDEPGLAGWTVYLDDDHDAQLDTGERYALTDSTGAYFFLDVPPGNYDVAQVGQPGWHQGYPLLIPRWVYVAEQISRPRDLFNSGYFVANQVQIFNQATLELIDTFGHAELDEGLIHDIEIGPGGDVYVAVDLEGRHGQIVQFTYDGEYLRTIDLPDDGPGFSSYPKGFDVLPDGGLLVPQPHNERILSLDANGSVSATADVPGFRPLDAGVLSDGTIVFTDNEADGSEDALLSVRSDDLSWVGTSDGAVLRGLGGEVFATRGDRSVREALETPEGILFATDAAIEIPDAFPRSVHRLVKYDADGNELGHVELVGPVIREGDPPLLSVETVASATGLAVALSEVPFGEPVRGVASPQDLAHVGPIVDEIAIGAAANEMPVPPASQPVNTGLGVWNVTVEPGNAVLGADFGNVRFSTVSGMKFNDLNQDGVRDADEPGLEGWVIYVDLDDDGVRDGREPFDTTHDGGLYGISTILPGTYKLREESRLPWLQTAPAEGYYEIVTMSGSVSAGLDFGNFQPLQVTGEIRGTVWHDDDTSGTRESGESGVAGWTVFLDDDNDEQLDSNERSTATDAGGNYAFGDLAPGEYHVAEAPRTGWEQIHPVAIPEWVYVGTIVRDEAARNFFGQIEIFDLNLRPIDTFTHESLHGWSNASISDVEVGPGGDVYVSVPLDVALHRGRIVQFTYDGEFVREIEIPDDNANPESVPSLYPLGFDVLADGRLLVAQPNSEQIVQLNPDGTLDRTFRTPGFQPIDVGILSDGFIVWTDALAEPDEHFLNVRYDDLYWVGTDDGIELRDIEGNVVERLLDGRDDFTSIQDAVEIVEGDVIVTGMIGLDCTLGRFGPPVGDHHTAFCLFTEGAPRALAVGLNEILYAAAEHDGLQHESLDTGQRPQSVMTLATSDVSVGQNLNPVNTGRGVWRVTVQPGQVVAGADFGVVELSTASGVMFEDRDGDQIRDTNETGLDDWIVYADLDDDGIRDGREPFATTANGGFYTIEGILPGTYKIRQEPQPAWTPTAPAAGYHEIHFLPGAAITGLDFGLREAVPPTLTGVTVGSTQWTQPFRDVLDPINGLGFPLPTGSDQAKALPWSHIDQVFIHFSEDVSVDRSQVGLFGVNRADYSSTITAFTYDAESHIAAVTLSAPLQVEKLLLVVSDTILDVNGNRLDGEWLNGANTFQSGDGTAGGTFAFRTNIVPGDMNRSGSVSVNDVGPLRSSLGSAIGSALYSIFADLNGSGAIAVNDVGAIRTNLGRSLPTGEPSLPTTPAVPANVLARSVDRLMHLVAIRNDEWLDNLSDEDLTSISDSLIPGLRSRRGAAFRA